ncbi:ArnT family glycosyltransferase [Nanoarchaeota archaeon]
MKKWLLVLFIIALLVRIWPLEVFLGWDESIYVQHAETILGEKNNYEEIYRPPVLPVFIAGGMLLWRNVLVAQVIVSLLSALMVFPLYGIAKKLSHEMAGIYAGLIFALHPLYQLFGHEVLTDGVVSMFIVLSIYLLLQDKWWLLLLSGLACGVASLTKYTMLAAIPIFLIFLFWQKPKKAHWFILGSALPLIPFLIWVGSHGGVRAVLGSAQSIATYDAMTSPFVLLPLFTIPLVLGLVLYAWKGYKKEDLPYLALSACMFLAITTYLFTIHVEARFILPVLAPFLPLAGIGYTRIKWDQFWAWAIIIIIVFGYPAYDRLNEPFINTWKPPVVDMAERISGLNSSLPLYVTSDYPVYARYTENQVVVVDGPHFISGFPLIMPREGYLVVYKETTTPPSTAWADKESRLTRIDENEQIVLYHYKPHRNSTSRF